MLEACERSRPENPLPYGGVQVSVDEWIYLISLGQEVRRVKQFPANGPPQTCKLSTWEV